MMNTAPGNATVTKRTFLAIELPPVACTWVQTLQRSYQERLRSAQVPSLFRWTAPEKLHITLRFLGETTFQQEQLLVGAISGWAKQRGQFHLSLQGAGCFPSRGAPAVLWVGIQGDLAALTRCQIDLEQIVQSAGFAAEKRAFSPHLTIARAQRNAAQSQLIHARKVLFAPSQIATTQARVAGDAPTIAVDRIVFMQSDLLPDGARYTPVAYFAFG